MNFTKQEYKHKAENCYIAMMNCMNNSREPETTIEQRKRIEVQGHKWLELGNILSNKGDEVE